MIDNITQGRRLRRLRQNSWIREIIQETRLHVSDLIAPIFLCTGTNIREPIDSMPNIYRLSIDMALEELQCLYALGIKAVAVFAQEPISAKCEQGLYVLNPDNLTNNFCRQAKKLNLDIGIIVDVALDPYTIHGHDGIVKNGVILNDETIEILCKGAIVAAQAGADIIAPSDMMDGRIAAIRKSLNNNNFSDIPILSYAAKFASNFYGPYRDAIGTKNLLNGDKKTYYLNPANANEAIREAMQDQHEGADMLMVKPGLPYLDIIKSLAENINLPILAYQVSGEYTMIKLAIDNGYLNKDTTILESLLAFKRAGCSAIFTYFAKEAAILLQKNKY
ncbi:porphobilinogen synthase [Bartonella sp. DGB1]|uniref:porphobilinogen synthase n=1 Tax=Bartonella sp. DGB1 TaxID=3239807 RepID=UPI00352425B1